MCTYVYIRRGGVYIYIYTHIRKYVRREGACSKYFFPEGPVIKAVSGVGHAASQRLTRVLWQTPPKPRVLSSPQLPHSAGGGQDTVLGQQQPDPCGATASEHSGDVPMQGAAPGDPTRSSSLA